MQLICTLPITLLGLMGPKLLTRLTVSKCGRGTGPFHTVKRHSTHQYFFLLSPLGYCINITIQFTKQIYVWWYCLFTSTDLHLLNQIEWYLYQPLALICLFDLCFLIVINSYSLKWQGLLNLGLIIIDSLVQLCLDAIRLQRHRG